MKKQENSTHTSVWIKNELYEECKSNMEKLDIKFFKDYIAEALEFYNQYLKETDNKEYINKTVIEPMEKMLKGTTKQDCEIDVQASRKVLQANEQYHSTIRQ